MTAYCLTHNMGTTIHFSLWLGMVAFTMIGKVECLSQPVYLVTSPDGNVTVEEGQPINLSCEVHNSYGTGQLQWDLPPNFKHRAPSVTWEDRQATINQSGMSKLTVDEAMMGDSGKYDCRIENIVKSIYVTVKGVSEIHDIVLDSNNIQDMLHVEMAIVPPRRKIQIMEGESVRVNCSVNLSQLYPHVVKNAQLSWITKKHKVHQRRVDNSTITLIIDNANSSDAGFYTCWFNTSQGSTQKLFYISVNAKSKDGAVCTTSQFLCEKHHHCIFVRYRCNGQEDCLDGSDEHNCEENPCVDQFPCLNGHCVDRDRVCDIHHENDCGDWSDELCIFLPQYFTAVNETTVDIPPDDTVEEDQMTWLKTTVYAVIGCTVGIVLFISIIVVAVFRIRMKRDACNQRERVVQRHQGPQPLSSNSSRPSGEAQESQPFLEGRQNYGNIIVNVNNGVQYVPVSEFVVMETPPTYSEVVEEIQVQHNSAPPDYSTLDRFPQRPNSLQVATSNNRRTPHRCTRQAAPSSDNQGTLPQYTAENNSRPPTHSVSVQTTRSQTAGQGQSSRTQHPRGGDSTRTSTSRGLPKQPNMAVQGGQIILRNQHLPTIQSCSPTSSDPTTSDTQPLQLQVQGGQIMLGGTDSANSVGVPPPSSPPPVTSSAQRDLPPLPTSGQTSCSGQALSAPPGGNHQGVVPAQSSCAIPIRSPPSDNNRSEDLLASGCVTVPCDSPENPLSMMLPPHQINNVSPPLPLNIHPDNVTPCLPANIPPDIATPALPPNIVSQPLPANIESHDPPANIESRHPPANIESRHPPANIESHDLPANIESRHPPANIESHDLPPHTQALPANTLLQPLDAVSSTSPTSVVSELTAESSSVLQGAEVNCAPRGKSSLVCQAGNSSVITPRDNPQGGALECGGGAKEEDESLYDAPWECDLDLFISEIPDRAVQSHSDSLSNQNQSGSSPNLVAVEPDITNSERNTVSDSPSQSTSLPGGHNYESINELRNNRMCEDPVSGTSSASNTIQVVDGRICLSNQNTFPRMSDSHHHSRSLPKTPDNSSTRGQITIKDGNIVLT
ncbi:uncharacterized protein LOC110442049 [Mizuhopecten yessoensis]|uniref:uncharacterized protein LOC110442049 n=1 Tax=Mizuhopecten yessoensis TaxID=6573 RepID=UPI000B4599D7|nr:uncharacterized protein LOC110442049 [Mizuhopecten yessoensis]